MPYDLSLREEELKNKVAADWFGGFDCTAIPGNIDFCVSEKGYNLAFLWAEAKKGNREDIYASFAQLILTIGKAHTFDRILPPPYLGAFDAEKIAFVPYHKIMPVFSQNDFNWKVTPSDHDSKEFRQLYGQVQGLVEAESLLFDYDRDAEPLKAFIKANFKAGQFDGVARVEITKYNFVAVYRRWAETVKPTIRMKWDEAKKRGILDIDFYIADLMSRDDVTTAEREKLYVSLNKNFYEFDKFEDDLGFMRNGTTSFTDGQKAYRQFWAIYVRPPKDEFWDFIIDRYRDLLVPQDVRERKGSYYTPAKWVRLSQQYLADALGYDWQDNYYIWDCAAGSGNLLVGLADKYKIWASTLDKQDVDVMKDRIKNGANLLESHVFQFDFLNDSFDKLPQGLREIVEDEEKRKRLVIYINPPYAEATNLKTITSDKSRNKPGVSQADGYVYRKYKTELGRGINEVFAQFLIRVAKELNGCWMAHFSGPKILQTSNFATFRAGLAADLKNAFLVPASTFDNVGGQFPIGFFVWETGMGTVSCARCQDHFGTFLRNLCRGCRNPR